MFPKLVKDNRFWELIILNEKNDISIYTRYGVIGGKTTETKPQIFTNKSKALTFSKKKMTKKIRIGYKPESGNTIHNKQVKNFIKPMGAILLEGYENKIKYPAYVQPKLDGFRGIAVKIKKVNNSIEILSRNGLPYPHLEKIKNSLETFPLLKQGYQLDGEIYLHGLSLGDLRSVLGRKKLNSPEILRLEKKIRYCVFDFFGNNIKFSFEKRLDMLKNEFHSWNNKSNNIILVETKLVNSLEDIIKLRNKYLDMGYEGIIVRNKNGLYLSGKNSQNVFRSKEFKKDIFKIVGASEGKGTDKGTVIWKLECLKDKSKTFTAKPVGTFKERTDLYKNKNKFIGLKIQVKYFELNNKTGCVSRHPIALKTIT